MSDAAAAGPVSGAGAAAGANRALIEAAPARCENCGSVLTGRYCSRCGQSRESPVHSLWDFTRVAAEDLTHADSRLWRTLGALLFRPGQLTREFLAGRRVRYLPPVRLYLVISLVFFLWASSSHDKLQVVQISDRGGTAPQAVLTPFDGAFGTPLPGESAEQHAERVCSSGVNYDGPWRERIQPAAHRACVRMLADQGRSLREAFLHNVPRAMFLFLPLLAGAMMLIYWWPRHYYVEHLLLFVHNHACVFLYIAWYLYRSMRVVYGQRRALTLGKLLFLSFFYLVSGSLMLALVSLYSVFTL